MKNLEKTDKELTNIENKKAKKFCRKVSQSYEPTIHKKDIKIAFKNLKNF